ncbi:hypothetical protein ACFLYT_01905, partial [Nanoarchaeota archaeon]
YSWIYWNWTNPDDDDFNTSIIYLNGIWQQNTTNNSFNATGLTSDTNYTITIHTQDHYGNINNIDQNSTTKTLLDTIPPVINNFSDNPDPVERKQNITITANGTRQTHGHSQSTKPSQQLTYLSTVQALATGRT